MDWVISLMFGVGSIGVVLKKKLRVVVLKLDARRPQKVLRCSK